MVREILLALSILMANLPAANEAHSILMSSRDQCSTKSQSDLKRAITLYQSALKANPDATPADKAQLLMELGECQWLTKQQDVALQTGRQAVLTLANPNMSTTDSLALQSHIEHLCALYDYANLHEHSKSLYQETLPVFQKSLENRITRLGPYDSSTYNERMGVAIILRHLGRNADAKALFESVVAQAQKEHNSTAYANALNWLGMWQERVHDKGDAIETWKKELEFRKANLPDEKHALAVNLQNVGMLSKQADPYLTELYDLVHTPSFDDVDRLTAVSCLATAYWSQNEVQKAEPLIREEQELVSKLAAAQQLSDVRLMHVEFLPRWIAFYKMTGDKDQLGRLQASHDPLAAPVSWDATGQEIIKAMQLEKSGDKRAAREAYGNALTALEKMKCAFLPPFISSKDLAGPPNGACIVDRVKESQAYWGHNCVDLYNPLFAAYKSNNLTLESLGVRQPSDTNDWGALWLTETCPLLRTPLSSNDALVDVDTALCLLRTRAAALSQR